MKPAFDAPTNRRRLLLATAAVAGLAWGLTGCSDAGKTSVPDVPFTQLDGSQHRFTDFKGKVAVINFWATSCSTCVKEMPEIVATHERYKGKGLETVAVAMQYDPPAYVMQFAQSRQLPFRVAMDHTGEIANAFGPVQLTPTTFVIDKKGRVVKRYIGEPDFKAMHALIEKLLSA